MTGEPRYNPRFGEMSFCSSLEDDVWHGLGGANAFESWHFDAVSDDGREALVITFHDNYPLSPRFHAAAGDRKVGTGNGASSAQRFPAVSLVYMVAGRTVFQAVNEFRPNEFNVNSYDLNYSIGDSSFGLAQAKYGSGFLVKVELRSARGRRLRGEFEWLFVESDLMKPDRPRSPANWNIVVPRADVSGKIIQIGRFGKARKTVQFRGTGYHDQITSEDVHYRDRESRLWGRAHFVDSTVVFDRHGGARNRHAPGQIFLIRNGRIEHYEANCEAIGRKRSRWGLTIPETVNFITEDDMSIRIRPIIPVRSGLMEAKMLSEITFGIPNEGERRTAGLVEFVDPRRLNNWLFRKVTDLEIGRSGRSPIM